MMYELKGTPGRDWEESVAMQMFDSEAKWASLSVSSCAGEGEREGVLASDTFWTDIKVTVEYERLVQRSSAKVEPK